MTKSVVQGYVYVVTAETTTTVTDAHGLNLTVQAGQQAQLVASGDTVELTGSATLTQLRAANFNQPAAGGGGHVVIDPVPVEGSSNAVASGGVFTALAVKQVALTAGDGITLTGSTLSVNANGVVNSTDTKPVSGRTVNAAIAGAVIGAGGAALEGNNTFSQTNTFNGAVALNGPVQGPGIDVFGAALIAPLADVRWLEGVTNGTSFNYRVFGENADNPKRTRIYGSFIVWVLPDVVNANSITRTCQYKTENATVIFSYPNATSGSVPIGWEQNAAPVLHARLYAPKMNTMSTVCSHMWTTCEIFAEALQSLTEGIAYNSTANTKVKSFTLHAPVLKTLLIGAGNVLECVHLYTPQVNVLDNLFTYAASTSTMPKLVEFLLTDSSHVTTAKNAFVGCTVLPANQYPTNWSSLKHGNGMFSRCNLLDAATANAILDSLPDWSTEETPADHTITFSGTAAATAWAAEGADLSHVEAAEAKGWTVER